MKRLLKFFRLSQQERLLLLESLLLVGGIRLGLWLLPFGTLRRLTERRSKISIESRMCGFDAKKVAWAVKASSRYVPYATCLTRAMATTILLGRNGQQGRLRIGVAKNREGKLEAHAWVESQGRIVIGRMADLSRYTVLPPLKKRIS